MCGIGGMFRKDGRCVDRADLVAMGETMILRGPDGEGFYTDGPVGLVHRRLAVIDLAGGAQPIFNEDGTLEGSLGTQRFTGKWSADPKDRSVSFTQLSPSSDNLSGMSKEFIQRLENARYYRGDSKTLQLAPESRTSCIQLTTKHDN